MTIEENKHMIRAYQEYMQARRMVRDGMLGNAHAQREYLRAVYRTIAGK